MVVHFNVDSQSFLTNYALLFDLKKYFKMEMKHNEEKTLHILPIKICSHMFGQYSIFTTTIPFFLNECRALLG